MIPVVIPYLSQYIENMYMYIINSKWTSTTTSAI